MSERNRYLCEVHKSFIVWADDPVEAREIAEEDERNYPPVSVEAVPAPRPALPTKDAA